MKSQMKKILFNFHIRPEALAAIRKLSGQSGAPVSEIVRRAIDAYLKAEAKK